VVITEIMVQKGVKICVRFAVRLLLMNGEKVNTLLKYVMLNG